MTDHTIKLLQQMRQENVERFAAIDQRFEQIDQRFEQLLDVLKQRFTAIDDKLNKHSKHLSQLIRTTNETQDLVVMLDPEGISKRLDALEAKVYGLDE